jgi:serine/threonine protein kinase
VWRARDDRLDRDVAIKTLPSSLSADAEHLARFRREARAASALSHPNICTIYDLGDSDPRFQALMGDMNKTWEQLQQV